MFERCLYFNSNTLARKLNHRWEQAFAAFDLAPSHAYLLRLVLAQPGMTQQAIAKELRLDKSTVARFVNKLEVKDLLRRSNSEEDSREKIIIPSPKAAAIHESLESTGDTLYRQMCDALGEDDLKALVRTMRKVSEKLDSIV